MHVHRTLEAPEPPASRSRATMGHGKHYTSSFISSSQRSASYVSLATLTVIEHVANNGANGREQQSLGTGREEEKPQTPK